MAYCEGSSAYGLIKDKEKGLEWIRKAAYQGHPDAQAWLGVDLAKFKSNVNDKVKGYAWLLLAKANGYQVSELDELIKRIEEHLNEEQELSGQNRARKLQLEIRAKQKAKKEAEEKTNKDEKDDE